MSDLNLSSSIDTTNKLQHKCAIITGAGTGIGAELAVDLVNIGYNVVLVGRSINKLLDVAQKCLCIRQESAYTFVCDLTGHSKLDELVYFTKKKFQKLDLLVNNACERGLLGNDSDTHENFRYVMDVNLMAPMFLIHKCMLHLRFKDMIFINISSIASQVVVPLHSYTISKTCLSEMSRQLSKLSEQHEIYSVTISPGPILTEERPQHIKMSNLPLQNRVGNPQEVSKFILFAIRNAAVFNGQELFIDGGYLARQKIVIN